MANLHKLTVQEAMNASGPGGTWTPQYLATDADKDTSRTAGSSADETNSRHISCKGAGQIGVYPEEEIYFRFSDGLTGSDRIVRADVVKNLDLKLPANTLVFLTIPNGLKDPYFNFLGVGTTDEDVRIALV